MIADGTFDANKRGSNYKNYYYSFIISQNNKDESLLFYISKCLNCSNFIKEKSGMCGLWVYFLLYLNKIIFSFIKKYKL
jgi:LAGLIDADG endonuclease